MLLNIIKWYFGLNAQVLEQSNGSHREIFEKALEQVTLIFVWSLYSSNPEKAVILASCSPQGIK